VTVPDIIPGNQITEFFREGFQHTAWRLETRHSYAADQRSEAYRQFLEGQLPSPDPGGPWYSTMRHLAGQGKRIERVRLVDDPPTDNQRYGLATAVANVAAGEDIRYLWRRDAERGGLPLDDFWLFDSKVLARFAWDDTGWATHLDLTDDPVQVLAGCQARDAAWHYAIRYEDFAGAVPSTV
jgi:hypothetical protein